MIEVARQPEKYLLSISDVEHMIQENIVPPEVRIELIHGELWKMTPIGERHIGSVIFLSDALKEALMHQAVISVQNPIELAAHQAPQPDIAVLRPPRDRYPQKRPAIADIHLVVEVADTSLSYDHNVKLPLYAEAGIPEVWIVNLKDDVLEVYRQPKGKLYGQRFVLLPSEPVTLEAFGVGLEWHA